MKAIFQTNKLIHIQYIETTQENLAAPNIIIRGPEVMLCGRYPLWWAKATAGWSDSDGFLLHVRQDSQVFPSFFQHTEPEQAPM